MSDVFQFMKLSRNPGDKVDASVRKIEFKEIYQPLHGVDAADQAGRCLSCGNPYCEWECPVHNYIPNWLKLVEEGACSKRRKCRTKPIACQKSAAEFAHRIAYAKARAP